MLDNFGFPYDKPYDIQIEFMAALYSTIQEGKIGLFSSPTGTGKSLSLLCGSLKCLMDYRESLHALDSMDILDLECADGSHENGKENSIGDALANEPEWVRRHALKQAQKDKLHEAKLEAVSSAKARKKRKLGFDIGYENHESGDDEDDLKDQASKNRTLQPVQIIFASRTHTQLNQLIGELKKTRYAKDFRVRSLTLGSRKQLCIKPSVQSLGSLNLINEKCKEINCEYQTETYDALIDSGLSKVHDMEDLIKDAQKLKICPYYGTREALPYFEIVTVPYSILLSKTTRESVNLSLQNSIVIVDEAHNLVDAISNIHSVSISQSQFQICLTILQEYLHKYGASLSGDNTVSIKLVMQLLKRILLLMKKNGSSNHSSSVIDFIFDAKLDSFDFFQLLSFIKDYRLSHKTMGIFKKLETHSSTSPLFTLVSLLEMISLQDEFGSILIYSEEDNPGKLDYNEDYERTGLMLRYLLLDPSEPFKQIVQESKSVILAGGTMEPINEFTSYLLPYVSPDQIELFSCKHVVPEENLITFLVSAGPSNLDLEFNFQSRSNEILLKEAGEALLEISKRTPDGFVVFFPSFKFMEFALKQWTSCSVMKCLKALKRVFLEPKSNKDVDSVLNNYGAEISSQRGGAILMCVVGGKLSEGINFSDGLARALCVIGLPYANIKSLELTKKMEYLDSSSSKGIHDFTGHEYYENLCMKAVNQTIGRAIRHKSDFAAIYLLDRRFQRPEIRSKLPGWMRETLKEIKNFSVLLSETETFFKRPRLVQTFSR